MSAPVCVFVAAVDRNGLLGVDGRLPWRLPLELQHFRRLTLGRTVVLGRRTHEALGRALPGRRSVVLSRTLGGPPEGCALARTLEEALSMDPLPVVIGGAEVFARAFPYCVTVHRTLIDHAFPAEGEAVYFPTPWPGPWTLEESVPETRDPHRWRYERWQRATA
ncbi:MAG: dihydrofolate reductase [Deltaproteobacteria bacterium]|nr:dihydrofolate reductase [Deltaproteobacteria bacterium]